MADTERALRFDRLHARRLRALAYRMLGSRAEAEDLVQETWLRWAELDEREVRQPEAFLGRMLTNLCLDHLKSAAQQREHYVGTWLPEPLVDEAELWSAPPEQGLERAQDLSVAFMLALERLSPLERAAFLLHDVFEQSFEEVGAHLQREAAACRQLASRARSHLKAGYARVQVAEELQQRLFEAFVGALVRGDVEGLAGVLAEDALLLSDGGGKATALPRPLQGGARIAQVLVGFSKGVDLSQLRLRPARINGLPGYVVSLVDGSVLQTVALELAADGLRLSAVYIQRNPDKLRHLHPRPADAASPGDPGRPR